MDKLGQLGVSATAVVNLGTCICAKSQLRVVCDTHYYVSCRWDICCYSYNVNYASHTP